MKKKTTNGNQPKELLWLEYEAASRLHDFYFYSLLVLIIGSALVHPFSEPLSWAFLLFSVVWLVKYVFAKIERDKKKKALIEKIVETN